MKHFRKRFSHNSYYCSLFLILLLLTGSSEIIAQNPRWKWICYGDTRTNDTAHRSVLQSIMAHSSDFKFMINVGDVIEDGRVPQDWQTWKKACDDILGGTGQESVPPKYIATAGNHDELMTTGLQNWKTYLSGQAKLYGNDGKYFYFDYENARFVIMHTEEPYTGEQKKMLLNAIENNPKTWLFLIWHKPIFSFGGKPYEEEIHKEWGVPLYKNGCDAIFNGHAHIYLRTKKLNLDGQKFPKIDPVNGIPIIITGNSGAPIEPIDQNRDGNAYMIDYAYDQNNPKFYGYTEMTVAGDTMYLKHISAEGLVMDQQTYTANPKISHLPHFHIYKNIQGKGTVIQTPPDSTYDQSSEVLLTAVGELGWKFSKWGGDLTGTVNPERVVMNQDKNITATFEEIPNGLYELRVESEGPGKVILAPPGGYYAPGTKVTIKAYADSACKFENWSGELTGTTPVYEVAMNSHKLIKAVFRKLNLVRLNIGKSANGTVTLNSTGTELLENTPVKLTATGSSGWEFMEWTGDKNGTVNPDTLIMTSSKEVKALFRKTSGIVSQLKAIEDSYVRGGLMYSDKNFDQDTTLRVLEGSSDMYRCKSFVKFDLHGVKSEILSAYLKMRVKEYGLPDGPPAETQVYSVLTDNWSEKLLKWKSVPQTDSKPLDSCITISSVGLTYSWDVTAAAKQEMKSDSILSLMLKDDSAGNRLVEFYSKESTSSPELVIICEKTSGISENESAIPEVFSLEQNYPNPFNPVTVIKYSMPESGYVSMKVYDLMGREVSSLVDEFQPAGTYKYPWLAKDKDNNEIASGVYICLLRTDSFVKSIKMLLLR